MLGCGWQDETVLVRLEYVHEFPKVIFSPECEEVQLVELCAADGRLQVSHLEVVSNMAINVLVVITERQVAELLAKAHSTSIVLSARAITVTAPIADGSHNAG